MTPMNTVWRVWIAVVLLTAAMCPRVAAQATTDTAGPRAPDFELRTIDGKPFRLSAHQGKVRVLFFVRDDGHFVPRVFKMVEKVVGASPAIETETLLLHIVAKQWNRAEVEKFRTQSHLNWVFLLDEDASVHRLYKVIAVPTVVMVDRRGIVKRRLAGFTMAFGATFRDSLRESLGLPPLRDANDVSTATRRAARNASMGNLMVHRGIWSSALRSYRTALEIDPEMHIARLGAGFCLLRMGQTDEARQEFEILLHADALTSQARIGLAWADAKQGKAPQARATLEGLPPAAKQLPEYHEAWAAVYDATGDPKQAAASREKAESLLGPHVRAPVAKPHPPAKK